MVNEAFISGRFTANPELKTTNGGQFVCSYTLAVNRTVNDKEYCDFIDCTVWGKQAEQTCKYCRKGDKICVNGEIHSDKFTDKQGNQRVRVYVNVKTTEFMFKRADRSEPAFEVFDVPSEEEMPF